MILGYGIIAIPTGIVTSEMTRSERKSIQKTHIRSAIVWNRTMPIMPNFVINVASKSMMNKTLISIVGPTGIGKTSLSIKLANSFQTEIISADYGAVLQGNSYRYCSTNFGRTKSGAPPLYTQ